MFNTPIGKTIFPVKPINLGCEFISGYAFKGSDFVETGHPVIKIKNIQNGRVTTEHSQFVSDEIITDKLTRFRLDDGDILIAMTGQGSVGRVGKLYLFEGNKPYLNQRVGKFVADEKVLNIDFLYYVISTQAYENYLFSAGSGSGQPNLSPAIIKSIEIPYPPYDVQCHIGKVLKDIDNKIELNRQTSQTLEQIAQAIFKSWFVDFEPTRAKIIAQDMGANSATQELAAQAIICGAVTLEQLADTEPQTLSTWLEQNIQQKLSQANPTGINPDQLKTTAALFPNALVESELGGVPGGWIWSEIGREVTVVGGGTPSTKNEEYWEGGDINWTTPRDMSNLTDKILLETSRKITPSGLAKISSGLLPVNTVLMSSRAPVGYLAITKIPVAINQGYIAMKCNNTLTPEYVVQWAESSMDEIKQRASGTTFAEINRTNFRLIPVLVPPLEVITKFSKTVSVLYDNITSNLKETKTLEELRDSLLPKLLSGELNVQ